MTKQRTYEVININVRRRLHVVGRLAVADVGKVKRAERRKDGTAGVGGGRL